jgi:hypothetical protein
MSDGRPVPAPGSTAPAGHQAGSGPAGAGPAGPAGPAGRWVPAYVALAAIWGFSFLLIKVAVRVFARLRSRSAGSCSASPWSARSWHSVVSGCRRAGACGRVWPWQRC